MPEIQTPRRVNTMALFVIGTLCVIFGLLILSQRLGVAELFLGAHFLFGVPLTNADALKLQFVAVGSAALLLQGAVIVITGFVYFLRNNAKPGATAPERSATSARL